MLTRFERLKRERIRGSRCALSDIFPQAAYDAAMRALAVLVLCGVASADPPPKERLVFSDLTVFRLNPLGLQTFARFGLQKRMYDSTAPVAENNFWFAGIYPRLDPVSVHLGVGGELQPLSIVNVRGFVEAEQYFGTLGYLQSFRTPTANYSDERLRDLRALADTSWVIRGSLQPLVQMKLGPLAARARLQLDYWSIALPKGDTVAYEGQLDTLLPDNGFSRSSDEDLLYVGHPGLAVGLRHSWVHPIYRSEHFANKNDEAAYDDDNAHHRLGVLAAYTLHDRPQTAFNKPTIVLVVSWYLSHRWRTGLPDHTDISGDFNNNDFITRAMPYVVLGFAFESDFYPAN